MSQQSYIKYGDNQFELSRLARPTVFSICIMHAFAVPKYQSTDQLNSSIFITNTIVYLKHIFNISQIVGATNLKMVCVAQISGCMSIVYPYFYLLRS